MNTLRSLAALAAIPAVVLLASSCAQRDNAVAPNLGTPSFHFNVFTCTGFKMTGGGRIDFPPGTADKNPPASHEYETFGAHVIAEPNGQTDELGHCEGAKGSLEWVDHRPECLQPRIDCTFGLGHGAAVDGVITDFSDGTYQSTDRKLDLARNAADALANDQSLRYDDRLTALNEIYQASPMDSR